PPWDRACAIPRHSKARIPPAAVADDDIAYHVARVARRDDLPDRAADHRPPDCGGRRIRFGGAHAAAHVAVEREVEVAHEHLAVAWLRYRRLRQLEIVEAGRAFGPALQ